MQEKPGSSEYLRTGVAEKIIHPKIYNLLYDIFMLHLRHVATLFLAMTTGCIARFPVNPSFPVSIESASEVLSTDTAHPKPLRRPLVIVGGFLDPGLAQWMLANDFRRYTHDDRVIGVSLGVSFSVEDYRQRIISAVDKAFPTTDPTMTTEVDVIGYSMGGLAARYAAITPAPGRRLRIARLFTISSPHRGARAVEPIPFQLAKIQEQMKPGSVFLNSINNTADPGALFPVYSYVCLGDRVVGPINAAPPGQTPWWVSSPIFFSAHDWAFMDPRIRADILARLRGDAPLSHDPPTALPPDAPAKTSAR